MLVRRLSFMGRTANRLRCIMPRKGHRRGTRGLTAPACRECPETSADSDREFGQERVNHRVASHHILWFVMHINLKWSSERTIVDMHGVSKESYHPIEMIAHSLSPFPYKISQCFNPARFNF
jgi:hypothetical protein